MLLETPNSRLPIVTDPYLHENIQGYILRLSELNLYERPRWVYALADPGEPDLTFAGVRSYASGLPMLSDSDPSDINAITYRSAGMRNHAAVIANDDTIVSVTLLDLSNPKICPGCVLEYGSVSSLWDLRPYVVCSRHKCHLINRCSTPGCSRRLTWWRPFLATCAGCKQPYRVPDDSLTPTDYQLEFSAMLEHRWRMPFDTPPLLHENPWSKVSASEFLRTVALLMSRLRGYPVTKAKPLSKSELSIANALALSLSDWPMNFGVFLEQLMKGDVMHGSGFSVSKSSSNFRGFFDIVMAANEMPDIEIVRDGLMDYMERSRHAISITGKGGNRMARNVLAGKRYLNRTEVMKKLSISAATFRKLFARGELKGEILQMGSQHVYRIEADSVRDYADARKDTG